ncbi:putative N-acetyltransferase YjaB [Vibrio thalassae]|uniref:Putative N-acetyltransferase YjaB n=1 Tax=Vibrio thalassae TaxID=1243014 RepID=A0A240ELJ1_9VIBR|nr:GNAT family N-acetyltransferase [Vibrio thalassae]SNX49548.1 putative N-acetyltransferase YjaB [Vibrio thalassae]
MHEPPFTLERFKPKYAKDVVKLWRRAFAQALGIEPIHSEEAQQYFLTNILPHSHDIWVVLTIESQRPIAFMAIDRKEINQLYVAPEFQRKGIGRLLVEEAQSRSLGELSLRTFQINQSACNFYRRLGFSEHAGNSDNAEGLEDLVFRWVQDCE